MLNARDGGINGVKITFEECETGYATDRGVECYERLKGKGPTGAAYFSPLSTGITFALTEKAPGDKIPLITMGYGRADSRDGAVFDWNFPLLGTYWTAANVAIQHIAKEMGGFDKLKGKKIALLYHDSPYGKEPIAALEVMSKKYGFEFLPIPVPAPGSEQKSQWLQIRQQRPDYVLLWGWGVMNSAAVTEAGNVNYPRDKMLGVWWSGAEPDVVPAGEQGRGLQGADAAASGRQVRRSTPTSRSSSSRRASRSPSPTRSAGALQSRPDQLDAGHRVDPHRHGQVRQQADDRRAGALGHRASRPHRRAHQAARLRGHDRADQGVVRRP